MDDPSLEDLDMFDSEQITGLEEEKEPLYNGIGAPVAAPFSPRPSSPSFYDPVGWSIAQLSSPGTESFPSENRRSSHARNESNSVNAVHMHYQDNARIPNYNHPVDRSNSSNSKMFPRSNYASDALLSSHPEQDNSMAELFLRSESSNRRSLNQAYEKIGSLSTEDANIHIQMGIEELAAVSVDPTPSVSVDPTPWCEIENKMHIEEEQIAHMNAQHQHQHQQHDQHQEQKSGTLSAPPAIAPPPPPPVVAVAVSTTHPHQSRYYPYGRYHQLPIPGKSSPPQISQTNNSAFSNNTAGQEISKITAIAIATAAAIACTNNNVATDVDNNNKNTSPTKKKPLATTAVGESSTMSSITTESQNKILVNNSYTRTLGPPNVSTPSIPKPQGQSTITQNYLAMKTGRSNTIVPNRHLQRQSAIANPPPHAAAHAVIRASVLAAANRKSQYGFGGNHTVPSVPAPPSIRSSNQPVSRPKTVPQNKQTTIKATTAAPASSPKPHIPIPIPRLPPVIPPVIPNGNHPTFSIGNHTGSAYERKKQKAKDARIKLNESIERLAIAVSLAGSQSKHRIDQLQNQVAITEFRKKSIQVNQEGIQLADNAKKWDRPSFVGTAASVIQSLNAQCEALMAELMAMQQLLDAGKGLNENENNTIDNNNLTEESVNVDTIDDTKMEGLSIDNTNTEATKLNTEQAEGSISHQPHKRHEQPVELVQNRQISNKRPRVEIKQGHNLPSDDEVVYGAIAKMLDPVSLCRCICVSKLWREMQAFQDEDIWLNLAVKRFGFYNVRQWSENLKDGEDVENKISNKNLYKEMNASNVMPHFSQEGLSLLGNGRIQGKISGWVFIVERSNGETLRSVKRDPSTAASAGGTYQSRPVVELRIVLQNTGMASHPVILKPQKIGVDVSTRRRGGELEEIYWDDRFKKVVWNMGGTIRMPPSASSNNNFQEDLCWLELFETAVLEVHINARGCSTISKFQQRSNFTKVLASLDGTTVPMVIPFLRDNGM